jgi:hypothetical protein
MKPNDEYGGAGVTLGWENTEAEWDGALQEALAAPAGSWIVQEKIAVRREVFPWFKGGGDAEMKDMLVDMAPYLFLGKLAAFSRSSRAAAPPTSRRQPGAGIRIRLAVIPDPYHPCLSIIVIAGGSGRKCLSAARPPSLGRSSAAGKLPPETAPVDVAVLDAGAGQT